MRASIFGQKGIKTMIRKFWHVPALLLAVLTAGCATPTQLAGVWKDPAYVGQPGQKVLIVALAQNERNEKIWESAFAHQLQAAGAQPIAGSTAIAAEAKSDSTSFKAAVHATSADLLAVTRLLAVDKEQEYVPVTTYYSPAPSYYGYYGYYNSAYSVVHTPGYIQTNTIVKLETNFYDVKMEKLVWSAVTQTINPETAQDAAESVTQALIDDLVAKGVIKK